MWLKNGGSISIAIRRHRRKRFRLEDHGRKSTAPCPAITPSIVAARTSGVAPLAVFFDASGTVSDQPGHSTVP